RNMGEVRNKLALQNIFTATYWPNALPRVKKTSIEYTLINNTLFLPIDQRLTAYNVEKIAESVLDLINN
ncbi:MAG: hypothetical protein HOP21_00460, partial [Methylotenera sp.]|nr:hypothetical protein [Methylotenera sp.]